MAYDMVCSHIKGIYDIFIKFDFYRNICGKFPKFCETLSYRTN